MNAIEAAKLLSILAAVDRREFDATTAQGWAWALHDVAYPHAVEAARRAMDAGAYVDATAIKTQMKAMRPRFEADVRSAKARGIIPDTWPATTPLPPELETRLRAAQSAEYTANNDNPEDIRPINPDDNPDLGQVGRGVD